MVSHFRPEDIGQQNPAPTIASLSSLGGSNDGQSLVFIFLRSISKQIYFSVPTAETIPLIVPCLFVVAVTLLRYTASCRLLPVGSAIFVVWLVRKIYLKRQVPKREKSSPSRTLLCR